MGFQLVEGGFYEENAAEQTMPIILNEAAVKALNLQSPFTGQNVDYKGNIAEIIGVVKNFCIEDPASAIQPLALTKTKYPGLIYIKFEDNTDRIKAGEAVRSVFGEFDSDFVVNPIWSEDVYTQKFDSLKMQSKIVGIGSLLSIFVAMLGLLAIHLYSSIRRTKEIGIRRVHGANHKSIFAMLSFDIIKWVAIAGMVAIPVVYYIASNWLNNFANHAPLNILVFILPVLIQCIIAILTTSGVSVKVLSMNPVEAIKKN
jgi:putative ABC transport system permease protein